MATEKSIKRSDLYQRMFSDEYMLEVFGTLTPSISERSSYFFSLWVDWRANRVKLKQHVSKSDLRRQLLGYGMKEFREFQIRNGEVRFADRELVAVALLSGLDRYTVKA